MITLQDITLYQGHTPLLEQTSVAIYPGQKVGVIGRNGCGKSTLFRLLMGEMALDGGEILMPDGLKRAQMKQETEASGRSAVDYVMDGHQPYREIERALQAAEAMEDHNAMAHLFADMEVIDGYNVPNKAEQLLSGLFVELVHPRAPGRRWLDDVTVDTGLASRL